MRRIHNGHIRMLSRACGRALIDIDGATLKVPKSLCDRAYQAMGHPAIVASVGGVVVEIDWQVELPGTEARS